MDVTHYSSQFERTLPQKMSNVSNIRFEIWLPKQSLKIIKDTRISYNDLYYIGRISWNNKLWF